MMSMVNVSLLGIPQIYDMEKGIPKQSLGLSIPKIE